MNDRQVHLAVLEHAYALLLSEAAKYEAAPLEAWLAHLSNIGQCVYDLEDLGRRLRLPMPPLDQCLRWRETYRALHDEHVIEWWRADSVKEDWERLFDFQKAIGARRFDEFVAEVMEEPMASARYWAETLPRLDR